MAELTALEKAARRKTKANNLVRSLTAQLAAAHQEFRSASIEFSEAKSEAAL